MSKGISQAVCRVWRVVRGAEEVMGAGRESYE